MPNKFTLYFRDGPNLIKNGSFPSFASASEAGLPYGYGNYHIDSGEYVPSRSEQLLEADAKPRQSRARYEELPD